MKKEYALILFDLDGTLIDTSIGIYNGLDYMLSEMGEPPIDESLKFNFVGPPMIETYPKFFGFSGEKLDHAISIYRKHGRNIGYKEFSYYPGIMELLQFLNDNDYPRVVVTMKEENLAKKQLDLTDFRELLTEIIGNNDSNPLSKADLIELARERYHAKPEQTLLIGDSFVDAKGAKEANIDFFPAMYGFGFRYNDVTEDYPYVKKLSSPTELISYLRSKTNE